LYFFPFLSPKETIDNSHLPQPYSSTPVSVPKPRPTVTLGVQLLFLFFPRTTFPPHSLFVSGFGSPPPLAVMRVFFFNSTLSDTPFCRAVLAFYSRPAEFETVLAYGSWSPFHHITLQVWRAYSPAAFFSPRHTSTDLTVFTLMLY